jgi:hypothetical protein
LENETGRAVLNQRCELRDEIDVQRCTIMWQIWYISEEDVPQVQTCRSCSAQHKKKQIRYEQSPYVLEDLLDLDRVHHWLKQQPADRIVATCRCDGDQYSNTFLEQYYREAIGMVSLPEGIKRPLWVLYLDGLMSGLLPQGRRLTVQVRAETVSIWLSCICAIHGSAEEIDLNTEEDSF